MRFVPIAGVTAAAAAAAVLVGALAQAVTGFGFALVVAPVLIVAVGARTGVQLTNLLAMAVNVALLTRERSGIRWGDAGRLLLPAVLVTPAAAYVVHRTNARVLSAVAGTLIAVTAGAMATGWRAAGLRRRGGAAIAGVVSAAMNTAGGVGGPAAAMYATNAAWPPISMRPTLQVYFLGLNIVTVIALGPVRPDPAVGAALLVALIAGLAVGARVADRLPVAATWRAILTLSFVGGLVAIARGVLG